MSAPEQPEAGGKGRIGKVSLVAFFLLTVALLVLPTTIILMAGMLPTLVAMLVARGRGAKVLTIGAINFAGCYPFLLQLWTSDHSVPHALYILMDLRNDIVMYSAAGAGYVLDWALAGIVSTVMAQKASGRLKDIRKRQAALAERWGAEVTGEMAVETGSEAPEKSENQGQ